MGKLRLARHRPDSIGYSVQARVQISAGSGKLSHECRAGDTRRFLYGGNEKPLKQSYDVIEAAVVPDDEKNDAKENLQKLTDELEGEKDPGRISRFIIRLGQVVPAAAAIFKGGVEIVYQRSLSTASRPIPRNPVRLAANRSMTKSTCVSEPVVGTTRRGATSKR